MDVKKLLNNSFLSLATKNTTLILLISINSFIIIKKIYSLNNNKIKKNKNNLINIFLIFYLIKNKII